VTSTPTTTAPPTPAPALAVLRGRIKTLQARRGYGFITDEAGADRFFHVSELVGIGIDALECGMDVTFEADADPTGRPRAKRVQRVDGHR
jgi:cold shock protein